MEFGTDNLYIFSDWKPTSGTQKSSFLEDGLQGFKMDTQEWSFDVF